MTTVGYGDKTPRSIAGRCFSVAWILAGIIVFNILAGELTSVIMQAKMVGEVSMAEQKVGTLDQHYENSFVRRERIQKSFHEPSSVVGLKEPGGVSYR